MQEVEIHTDGSCLGNPGPSGWAAILIGCGVAKSLSGPGEERSTNNRAELLAAINGLMQLSEPCKVSLHTDSQYVIYTAQGCKSSKNKDLVNQLRELLSRHEVTMVKVKGHSGDRLNDTADKLAKQAAKKLRKGMKNE